MNLKTIKAASAFLLAAIFAPDLANAGETGVMSFTFEAPHRDRLIQSLLFYPAVNGGMPDNVGGNIVFKGEIMRRDAQPEKGKHPLVVVSHGSGSNAASLAWLARRLAAQGHVVAITNHQGSTSGDSTPETTIPAMWQRPADISGLLDAISATTALGSLVDTSDVTALGFSLGGAVVLNLAGARYEAGKLASFCDANPDVIGCPWLAKGNTLIPGHVDLHAIDAARFNAGYADKRIKRFIAIDPGFVPALNEASLETIADPVLILNLGDLDTMPAGQPADHVAAAIGGRYKTVAGATHFDFLPACKFLGWFFIWMEGDDPVCTQSGSRSRDDIHGEIADAILAFLKPAVL